MRRVSLNARSAHEALSTDEVEVALFAIEHASLDAPIRLSTDPTERLSIEPDLQYGTRSTWYGANPATEPYLFIVASAELPSDLEDAPASANLVLANLDSKLTELLLSFTDLATFNMAVVLSSSPDLVEIEYHGMVMSRATGNANEISLELTRPPIEEEVVPTDSFTKSRFPGLFA